MLKYVLATLLGAVLTMTALAGYGVYVLAEYEKQQVARCKETQLPSLQEAMAADSRIQEELDRNGETVDQFLTRVCVSSVEAGVKF